MSQFYQEVFALLFGAFIVVLFSYERFNRTTYDTGTRLERLVALLSPDKMRARRSLSVSGCTIALGCWHFMRCSASMRMCCPTWMWT
jgi:hypothetical protein